MLKFRYWKLGILKQKTKLNDYSEEMLNEAAQPF